jgi:hypothetical protein
MAKEPEAFIRDMIPHNLPVAGRRRRFAGNENHR